MSHNARLTVLTCGTCRLTAVDVSGCPELGVLFCANNQLTGIDTSRLSKLWKLNVYGNRLTSLDLNGNLALKELGCSYNSLSALDLSPCRDLEIVDCAFNGLTTLDLSANKALKELCCDGNRLDKLDVSCCARLYHLQCNDNRLTGLDVSNNTALQALYCRNNRLDALNVSWNKKLVGLSCDGNHLTALDVANNTKLQYLNCSGNQLFYMDLTGNRNLRDFSCETRLEIWVTGRRFDLTQIEGFRYKKAADWTGGAVKGSTLTVAGETVTCRIKCGRGFTIAVELLPSFVKASLSSAKLAYTSKVYTGGAWEPAVTVKSKVNGKTYTLDPDEDYTVTYRNNIKAGTATVTIKGRGHYKGTLTKKFVIKPVKILKVSLSNSKLPYTGKARKPIPTVTTKVDGRLVTLVKNTDYTVKYENNVEIGTATVTVTGKGNYTGTIKKTFTITEKQ